MDKTDRYLIEHLNETSHVMRELEYRLAKIEQMMKANWEKEYKRNSKQKSGIKKVRTTKKSEEIRNDLLGRLTTLLIRSKFLPTNADLVEFAETHLGIKVPSWHKRSRSEIIGVIVEDVYTLSAKKIEKFYEAASAIQEKHNQGEKIDDFFGTWQTTIKSLRLNR